MNAVEQFAQEVGARQVWRIWRDQMLSQGRHVPEERMEWETLPEQDKRLDERIAISVVFAFLSWLKTATMLVQEETDASDTME
jgi:hypothetical protein